MCHHDDRLVEFIIEPVHQVEDFVAGLRIEVTGWFVGNDQRWICRDRTGDGHALFLSTRKLARVVVHSIGQANDLESCFDLLGSLAFFQRRERQWKFNVLVSGKHRNQVVHLKDETNVTGSPFRQRRLRRLAQVLAANGDTARCWFVESCDQVQ